MIKRNNRSINLQYTGKVKNLPEELQEKINNFWDKATQENPNLYNGEDYVVDEVIDDGNQTTMKISKSNYAHYLYDERVGIEDEIYRSITPWSGILLLTNDNYWVCGQMDKTTSYPEGFQIPGGGFDKKEFNGTHIDLVQNLRRELKEEVNLNLDDVEYEFKYIECPTNKRNAYGFLAIGKIDMTKDELSNHFIEYKKYLEENNLEVEFDKLIFFKKGNAVNELDSYNNPKRPYLRELLFESDNEIKNFVFDFGNVLFKFDADNLAKEYTDNEEDRLEIREYIFKAPEWKLLDNGKLTYDEAKKIYKDRVSKHLRPKVDEIMDTWFEKMPINYKLCDLIKKLKEYNYHIYALSNTHEVLFDYVKNLDVGKYFDGLLLSAIEVMMKPNKEIYERLLEKFDLIPEECLFIDDREKNVLPAKDCGMHGLVYDMDTSNIKDIAAYADL
jgi:putative hydrolase of the HAD superfamily